MPSCSLPGCNNRPEKDRVRGVSFHSLPLKKPLVAKEWLDQIRRDSFSTVSFDYTSSEAAKKIFVYISQFVFEVTYF